MFRHASGLQQLDDLRSRAAQRLSGGRPTDSTDSADSMVGKGDPCSPASRATDALAVLHAMASTQDTAGDALALLHELQVHQVEVEMQAEELRDSRTDLEAALRRHTALYDAQPVACFTVDRELVVTELNLAGARLLGLDRDEASGLPLDTLLSAASAMALRQLLLTLTPGTDHAAKLLQWVPREGPLRSVRADVGPDPAGAGYLLVLTELVGIVG